jgi:putative ABC transport system substrate-binding protein
MRRIGVMLALLAADDPEAQARVTAFVQALQERGWTDGRNVRIEFRWPLGDADRQRRYASELVALAPDVVLAGGNPALVAFQQASSTLPIVFANVADPVGAGHVVSLARQGGLIVNGQSVQDQRDQIVALAARHRLPAIYPFRGFVAAGGLISFGNNQAEPYRLAASYVDRILRGEADLLVQAPTTFETVINLKTAHALGLTVPETLLATADEVIQ